MILLAAAFSSKAQDPKTASKSYFVKLVCESADKIVTVKFDGASAAIVATADTRILQSDISGPHGIAIAPDKKTYFVSIGHGRPFGFGVKYAADTDKEIGQLQQQDETALVVWAMRET